MSLPRFEYLAPRSLSEACSLLSQYKGKAKLIAGGTDLLVSMKNREQKPQYLIGLKNVPDLNYIKYDGSDGLRIGALASHQTIARSSLIRDKFNPLAEAASKIGTPQIRNLGTVGGNLCNAAPTGDTISPLMALGATVKLVGMSGERTVLLEQFFTGPLETIRKDDEILTEIHVTRLPPNTGGAYIKLTFRGAVGIATVGVGAVITSGQGDKFVDTKIAITTAATPMRAKQAEAALMGKRIEDSTIAEAAQKASAEAHPRSSIIRGSADYRKEMVKALTKRAITLALERARLSRP